MPASLAERGSQRWLQIAVNQHQALLDRAIGGVLPHCPKPISWLSPLAHDHYREYRDGAWLELLGVDLPGRSLADFWPARGPVWDALGRSSCGEVILVEAKAHIAEIASPRCMADGASHSRIQRSIEEVRQLLAPRSNVDWTGTFYQYTNRLAHLYLLRVLNRVPAELVFLYFLNARDVSGPSTAAEWQGATKLLHAYLGLRHHPLLDHVHNVYVDAADLPDQGLRTLAGTAALLMLMG